MDISLRAPLLAVGLVVLVFLGACKSSSSDESANPANLVSGIEHGSIDNSAYAPTVQDIPAFYRTLDVTGCNEFANLEDVKLASLDEPAICAAAVLIRTVRDKNKEVDFGVMSKTIPTSLLPQPVTAGDPSDDELYLSQIFQTHGLTSDRVTITMVRASRGVFPGGEHAGTLNYQASDLLMFVFDDTEDPSALTTVYLTSSNETGNAVEQYLVEADDSD